MHGQWVDWLSTGRREPPWNLFRSVWPLIASVSAQSAWMGTAHVSPEMSCGTMPVSQETCSDGPVWLCCEPSILRHRPLSSALYFRRQDAEGPGARWGPLFSFSLGAHVNPIGWNCESPLRSPGSGMAVCGLRHSLILKCLLCPGISLNYFLVSCWKYTWP